MTTRLKTGILLALGGWACRPPPVADWHEAGDHRWRDVRVSGSRRPGFAQLSPSTTGIQFSNSVSQELMRQNRHLVQGAGVTLGDFDADGLTDIYLARTEGPNALYRNLGDWRFADVAAERGVAAADRFSTGAAFADVDGDRDLDLLVTALGGPNVIFVNDGTGHFTESRYESEEGRGSTTMALADIEGDGDLDLFVANYKLLTALDLFAPQERAFDHVVERVGDAYRVAARFQSHYRVEVRPDLGMVVRIQRADPDWFYLNDGSGGFERVPRSAGRFLGPDGAVLREDPERFGLVARFHDVDGDGDPDLYVCNDFEDPDELWINDGTGRFRAAPAVALRTSSNSSMAVDFSDVDRDGDVDFLVVDMLSRNPVTRMTQTPTHTPLPKLVGEIENRPQLQRNTLFLNRGDGTFAEIAAAAGLAASEWSWSTLFLDVDLDGYEDVLVATGHLWDVMDADTDERLQTARGRVDWRGERFLYPRLALGNVAFRNNGDLTFSEVGRQWGFAGEPDISHGMAAGDLDNDGDLDVVINRLEAPAVLLRNDARAGRVAVRLHGRSPNTQGVGARIVVRGGGLPDQSKEVTLGGAYLSSSDPMYSFATGDGTQLSIDVTWRRGGRTVVREVGPNRIYEIRETLVNATELPAPRSPPDPAYFTDVSDELNHRHVEAWFDDMARQPLLPHGLSQLGPGMSWYDVDDDGDEDLLIATGKGGRLGVFRNDGRRLTNDERRSAIAEVDQTTILGIPGGILVGQSHYEARTPGEALATPSVVQVGVGGTAQPRSIVPADTSSAGPLALADYDGDGDLDLFVGGRVIPFAYPVAATSRLYQNDAGGFVLDTANAAALRSVGMVSAAVFSDLDGDGDPDLLLALELGPVKLLLNQGGRFTDTTDRFGLARYISRWNGITTGDLDGDGRLDIVATSWGRNTRYRVTPEAPLLVYYGDFDRNRTVDVVEAQFDPIRRGIFSLEPLSRMARAIPSLRARVQSHAAYAAATLEEVLGPELRRGQHSEVSTLDHTIFFNRGGRFEAVPLPLEAQFTPAFYAGVADFDGDGHEDLFLSQNFFPTEIGTRRYDAGRGLWLRGDGSGALRPVPGQVSGVTVYGDQRGAALADYNGDGRVDLVVSQNGAETKLYRNDRAAPGLRVRLVGPAGNPHGIGAVVRLVYAGGRHGPAREIHAGSGYWSQDGAVQVLGRRGDPVAVWVRWPGGGETETPVELGALEVTVRQNRRGPALKGGLGQGLKR